MSIYNKEFSRAMAHFRPEFGNEKHIRACKLLKKLSEADQKLEIKINEMSALKKLAEEMQDLMKTIVFLLKKEEENGDKTVDEIYKKWITK